MRNLGAVLIGLVLMGLATPALAQVPLNQVDLETVAASAEQGDPAAQFEIAERYAMGRSGVGQSNDLALRWYRRAAESGHPLAAERLGFIYELGGYGHIRGVRVDRRQSGRWYRQAAELYLPLAQAGDPVAQTSLGTLYRFGKGVREDDTQAVAWYRRAAEQGHFLAQSYMALMYSSGEGVPQDFEMARWWNLQAAENGQNPEMTEFGASMIEIDEIGARQRAEADAWRAELRRETEAEESAAFNRLVSGVLVAAVGGDERQIGQALRGEEVTAAVSSGWGNGQVTTAATPAANGSLAMNALPSTRASGGASLSSPRAFGQAPGASDIDTSTHNQCITPIMDEPGFGSFENGCSYSVEIVFCVLSPREGAWSDAFDCAEQAIGMMTVAANRRATAHVKGGEGVYWLACRRPALPHRSVYEPGRGIIAQCY